MRAAVITGFLVILAISGCASMKAASPSAGRDVTQAPVPTPVPPVSPAQSIPPAPAAPPGEADAAVNKDSDQSSMPPKTPDTAPAPPPPVSAAARSNPPKAKSSTDTRPAKQPGAAAAQTRSSALPPTPPAPLPPSASSPPSPPAAPPKPISSPTLNLTDLEQRLRETRAIGVFTKLSLKNQVDDLLDAFRTLYRGPNKHPPAELRQRYDLLLLKVLTLLQDGDPPLAAAIASSREALWSILADPDKFATI